MPQTITVAFVSVLVCCKFWLELIIFVIRGIFIVDAYLVNSDICSKMPNIPIMISMLSYSCFVKGRLLSLQDRLVSRSMCKLFTHLLSQNR